MEPKPTNLKDSDDQQSNYENDIYQGYNNDKLFNEIENFEFLQEIASNFHNESNIWEPQLLLENENIQNQNTNNPITIPSLSNSLLPMEQAMQQPDPISENHEDTTLHCVENHSNVATDMDIDQLDQTKLDAILVEMLDSDPRQKLKRKAHTRNSKYVTSSLNKSLFNESPVAKRIKTPLYNSPASTSHQSFASTRAPSPQKTHETLPSQISMPLSTNQNEDLANVNDVLMDTPISTVGNNESFEFEIPEEFPSIENFNLMDISHSFDCQTTNLDNQCSNTTHTIDPLLYTEQITQLESSEDEIDKNNLESVPNVANSQTYYGSNTNSEVSPQRFNEASTSYNANNTNEDSIYVPNNDNTSLDSIDLSWDDTQELLGITFEETDELLPEQSYVNMIMDASQEPIEELNEVQGEPLVQSTHNDMEEFQNVKVKKSNLIRNYVGVHKVTNKDNYQATLPRLDDKKDVVRIGIYTTLEAAARVRDLTALKLKMHEKVKNFTFNYPISRYKEDLEEMQKWSEVDYLWAFKRQAVGFKPTLSGFKCVHKMKQYKASTVVKWEGRINNPDGKKKIKGFKKNIIVDQNIVKEIPAIFVDLVNIHLEGWDIMTNFRPGHYTDDDVQKFIVLLEEKKVHQAYEWDLVKRILKEPLPSNVYKENSPEIIQSNNNIVNIGNKNLQSNNLNESSQELISIEPSPINIEHRHMPSNDLNECLPKPNFQQYMIENFVAKLNPKDMAKHFIECAWTNINESWALYRYHVHDCDVEFENTIADRFKASNWSPCEVKSNDDDCKNKKEYKFYFPCVIATKFVDVNIHRRILGLDYLQYLSNKSQTYALIYYQKQWVNLPNIRYLELDFYSVIACNGGLIVVKRENNGQNVSDPAKNKSTILITNPLTYEIRFLPPIPYKILRHRIARLIYYDSTRTTYRLIVIGASHCKCPTIHDDDIQSIGSTPFTALLVYCSIKEAWVHFEHILNASLPCRSIGYSTIVVYGYSIYYGGFQISPEKQDLPKPVIFYFNINSSRRQQLIIDFTKAGEIYCIKVVEPPRLVQVGFNTKIYAVSREAGFKEYPDTLFITEVVVNEDGTPTGSFKVLTEGIMPKDLYALLFRRIGKTAKKLKMVGGEMLPPWEVIASIGHIAIKVIGFDPLIALYNVKDQNWNYTYFPYTETILEHPNTKAWGLIPGVYEPRWNATP